jgi:hypothetical protein
VFLESLNLAFFEEYLELMEDFLSGETKYHRKKWLHLSRKRTKKLKEDLEAGRKINPNIPVEEQLARLEEEKIGRIYTQMLRQSFFLTLYAFLENAMDKICIYNESESKPYTEAEGNGIDKAKGYLRGLGVEFGRNAEWSKIKNYQKLRDCIAHNQGLLNERFIPESKRKALSNYVNRKNEGLFLSGEKITLDDSFCENVLHNIRDFLDSLIESL